MREIALAAIALASVLSAGARSSAALLGGGPTAASGLVQSAQSVLQYQKLELTLPLASYADPFDPEEVDIPAGERSSAALLEAVFTTPSGRAVKVPGFYYQDFERSREAGGGERLSAIGTGVFKIRFAWGEVGSYSYQVTVREAQGKRQIGSGRFAVRPGPDHGYIRRSKEAPLYFEFDRGPSYFAIGENVCWPGGGGTYDYDTWLPKLAASGGNYFRIWMANNWNPLGLEVLSTSSDDGRGLGRYDQRAAWRIDQLLDSAHQLDLRVLMCIESFNTVASGIEYAAWDQSPYRAANGGPCAKPFDFFTKLEAERLFKRRLRYIAARWGYSTSVFAWELWNEVDQATGYQSEKVADWHREMCVYLRASDPWAHPITTSFADTNGDKAVDKLTMLDFVQSHGYGMRDEAGAISDFSRRKIEAYRKPHIFSEFGADVEGTENASDPEGIHLHNGLWAGMLSGSAGTAMIWWWDSYVEPQDLYHHFASVAAFARDVDWVKEAYQPATMSEMRFLSGQEPAVYPSVIVSPPAERWEDSGCNEPQAFQVAGDGSVSNLRNLSRVLHGTVNHPTWHNPATFQVDYPQAGRFEVMIGGVSGHGGAGLSVSLDAKMALLVDFPDRDPATDDLHDYDNWYGIDVPAGLHTIVVENPGADWCYVSYRLTNYLRVPNLRLLALANPHSALVWVQNKENTWWNHKRKLEPTPIGSSQITLSGFEPGEYRIEQWDTYQGVRTSSTTSTSTDGSVVITTPAGLTTDVAYKVRQSR